jgi:hypothetical protein
VSYETVDDFLLDLDPIRRRTRLRAEAEQTEPPTKPKPVDADQGNLGSPLSVETKLAPDAWLMEVTDAGRIGGDGVQSEDFYRTNPTDLLPESPGRRCRPRTLLRSLRGSSNLEKEPASQWDRSERRRLPKPSR